jgi:predicted YcjX-like family ATPase
MVTEDDADNNNVFEQLIEEEIERVNLEADKCGEVAIASVRAGQGNSDHAWLDKELEGVESEL